jgi:ribosomal protein L21
LYFNGGRESEEQCVTNKIKQKNQTKKIKIYRFKKTKKYLVWFEFNLKPEN